MQKKEENIEFISSMYAELTNDDISDKLIMENKLNYWQNKIYNYCKNNKIAWFTLNNLIETFTLNNLRPSSLKNILEILIKNKIIFYSYSLYPLNSPSTSFLDFAFNKIYDTLSVSSYIINQNIFLYYEPCLKEISEEIENQFLINDDKSPFYNILTLDIFCELLNEWNFNFLNEHIIVILGYMQKNNFVKIKHHEMITYIKFSDDPKDHINDIDIIALKLKCLIKEQKNSLDILINNIKTQKEKLLHMKTSKACEVILLRHMRRYKNLCSKQEKITDIISNLEDSLYTLCESKHTKKFVETSKMFGKVIKNYDIDKAIDVMDDVKDTMDNLYEMMSGLNINQSNEVDDSEILKEYDSLLIHDVIKSLPPIPEVELKNKSDGKEHKNTSEKIKEKKLDILTN